MSGLNIEGATTIEAIQYMANDGIVKVNTVNHTTRYFRIKNGRLQIMDLSIDEIPNKDKWIDCPSYIGFIVTNDGEKDYTLIAKDTII